MLLKDIAAAETIGAILLTAVIAAVIGIYGYLWITQIPLSSPPHVNFEIACGNASIPVDYHDYYCRGGVIGCSPNESSFLSHKDCSDNCLNNYSSGNYQDCVNDCESPVYCADTKNCNSIFICHNGGDPLEISRLKIFVNNKMENNDENPYYFYNYTNNNPNPVHRTYGDFTAGEILNLSTETPESVMITYQEADLKNEYVIVNKNFR